jgi:hypothetical protein
LTKFVVRLKDSRHQKEETVLNNPPSRTWVFMPNPNAIDHITRVPVEQEMASLRELSKAMDANPEEGELAERIWQANFGPDKDYGPFREMLPRPAPVYQPQLHSQNSPLNDMVEPKNFPEDLFTFNQSPTRQLHQQRVLERRTESRRRSSPEMDEAQQRLSGRSSGLQREFTSFDGASDNEDISRSSSCNKKIHHRHTNNNTMEVEQSYDSSPRRSPSKPKPLSIFKQYHNQSQSQPQPQSQPQTSLQKNPPAITYPPRVSSILNRQPNDSETFHESLAKVPSIIDIPNSAVSNHPAIFDSVTPESSVTVSRSPSQPASTYNNESYLSNTESSAILGDFIPIASLNSTCDMAQRSKGPFGAVSA